MAPDGDGRKGVGLRDEADAFLLALQFLTRLPPPREPRWSEALFRRSMRWHPAIGALIGLLAASVFQVAAAIWNQPIAVLMALAATMAATGALHEDGLADSCDAMGARDRDRALAIMKDSRIGAFGLCGLVSVLALEAAALIALGAAAPLALVVGHSLSRASALVAAARSPYAREESAAKPTSKGIERADLLAALAFAAGVAALSASILGVVATALGLLGLAAGHLLIRAMIEPKIGGHTGDSLGAVQKLGALGFYLGLGSWL